MPEPRITPELHTTKEMLYSESDGKWYKKMDRARSEAGAYLSMGTASSGDITSQLTDTRSVGGVLTGVGTLGSAGMKFLLKEILVSATKAATVSLHDGATTGNKRLNIIVGSGSVVRYSDLDGIRFSSEVRVLVTTGDVGIHVGGLRYSLLV
jgi:hypothetical protein